MRRKKKGWPAFEEQDLYRPAGQKEESLWGKNNSFRKSKGGTANPSSGNAEGYEAFISYRHLPLDIFVAENLHKLLEHYTIPKKARWGGRKHIRHIFRDRDELPISSDLSASITEALHKADHLIIICTPHTMESAWVQKEIETFLQTHTRDDIILVLAEGEPEESFPEIVLKAPDPEHPGHMIDIEPLAADVRGTSRKEVLKKMKEEKLRIMASLLNAPYDTLVQRERDFRMKRIVSVGSVIGMCLLSFGIYTAYQNRRISSLYNQTNLALAESTVQTSQSIYEEGDRIGAIETLLSAVDENGNLLSAQQIYPLSVYTGAYRSGLKIKVDPVDYFETDAADSELKASPDGKYAGWRNQNGFCVYDLENQQILRTIKPEELNYRYTDKRRYYSSTKNSSTSGFEFVGEDEILVYLEGSLFLVNYQSGDVLARAAFDESENYPPSIRQMNVTGQTVTLLTDEGLQQYDLKNDLQEIVRIPLDSGAYCSEQSISVSPGADQIALCIDTRHSNDKKTGLAVITPSKQEKIQWLSEKPFSFSLWSDDHTLITMGSYNSSGDTNQYRLTTWQDGKALKESGPWSLTPSQEEMSMKMVHLEQKDQLAVFSDFRLYMLDPLSHELNWQSSFSGEVDGIYTYGSDTMYLIKTDGRTISRSSVNTEGEDMVPYFNLIQTDHYMADDLLLLYDNRNNLSSLVTLSFADSRYVLVRYKFCEVPEEGGYPMQYPVDIQWGRTDQKEPVFLAVGADDDYSIIGTEDKKPQFTASLYRNNHAEPVLTVECTVDNPALNETSVETDISRFDKVSFDPGFTLIEEGNRPEIVWSDGKKLYRQMENEKDPSETYLSLRAPAFIAVRKDGDWTAVSDDKGVHLYEWNGQDRSYQEKKVLEVPSKAAEMAWSADDRYLVLSGKQWLRVWDQEKGDWVLLEGTEETEGVLETGKYLYTNGIPQSSFSTFRLGKKKPLLLAAVDIERENGDHDAGLLIYDLSSGKQKDRIDENQLGEVELEDITASQADFTMDDQSLILAFDVQSDWENADVLMYSLTENRVLWRQYMYDGRVKGMAGSGIIVSDTDQSFVLDAQGGFVYSRTNGLEVGEDRLYQYDSQGAVLCIGFDSDEIHYSPDLKQAAQYSSDGFVMTPILNARQLAERGREMLKEAERIHQKEPGQGTD